jgi:adenylosuccinate synthase
MASKNIKFIDICFGLAWGDEAKGKIVAHLAKTKKYNFICRWAGGSNAGHTIYVDGKKYVTHLIPAGIFYNIPSIIGPDCVINETKFKEELDYLQSNGFNIDLIKVSPKCHVVLDKHIIEDVQSYSKNLGTTSQGIALCYKDKYARTGVRAENIAFFKPYIWDETLYGTILCEGAQGFWLDINYGNYPYITSSTTLPYGACSLGFSPKLINNIYGASKIYDTRSGIDPDFPPELLDNPELKQIALLGEEYGATTGRPRIVNWLNLDKLIKAITISGTTHVIISKTDIVNKLGLFKCFYKDKLHILDSLSNLKGFIDDKIKQSCILVTNIIYSNSPENIEHDL